MFTSPIIVSNKISYKNLYKYLKNVSNLIIYNFFVSNTKIKLFNFEKF